MSVGSFVVYRKSDGAVLRSGECQPGDENEQLLFPEVEAVLYCEAMVDPNAHRVIGGRLVRKSES